MTTGLVIAAGGPMVSAAFGHTYTAGSSFSLSATAWVFALAGAVQALVQLAQLDAVARGSAAVGRLVLGGIGLELAAIVTFAHRDPVLLITTAATVAALTAAGGLTLAARAKDETAPSASSADLASAAS
jgi:hypothetical protein